MKNTRRVGLSEILHSDLPIAESFSSITPDTLFADVYGFHIYGRLGIDLRLSAAEDDKSANRQLRILEAYTEIVDHAASTWGVNILEVQGEIIHCFLPCVNADQAALWRTVGFTAAVTQEVYRIIPRLAGGSFEGYKSAADHGRSIIVGLDDKISVVSLGPCANAPAKRLPSSDLPAAHLNLRREHWNTLSGESERTDWVSINVLNPILMIQTRLAAMPESRTLENFTASRIWEFREKDETPIHLTSQAYNFSTGGVPVRLKGFFFRADQDGFSKRVENAFSTGSDRSIAELVADFCGTVQHSKAFNESPGWSCLRLPWAGDCANMILLPRNGQSYEAMSEKISFSGPKTWHELWTENDKKVGWAVGIAGGNGAEGNDGVVLVSTLKAANRTFPIAAGWSVRRSQDAYQTDGVRAEDTVVPIVDKKRLDSVYQEAFRPLDTRFERATLKRMQNAEKAKSIKLMDKKPIYIAPSVVIPQPRPFSPTGLTHLYDRSF